MLSVADMGREVTSQRRKERDQLITGQGRRRSRVQPPKVRKSTVTIEDEAATAIALGVDALLVQGPEAGGHRGTFDPAVVPETKPLDLLLIGIAAKKDLPLIAAGSICL